MDIEDRETEMGKKPIKGTLIATVDIGGGRCRAAQPLPLDQKSYYR